MTSYGFPKFLKIDVVEVWNAKPFLGCGWYYGGSSLLLFCGLFWKESNQRLFNASMTCVQEILAAVILKIGNWQMVRKEAENLCLDHILHNREP